MSSFFALELHRAECEFLTGAVGSSGGAIDDAFHRGQRTLSN